MKPKDFKRWRRSLGLSQKEAADRLGLKRRVVQYYEKGERDGKDVEVPKTVRLACYALTEGVSDYHGPREAAERAPEPALRLVANGAAANGAARKLENGAGDALAVPAETAKKADKRVKSKDKEKDKGREKDREKKSKAKDRGKEHRAEKAAPTGSEES